MTPLDLRSRKASDAAKKLHEWVCALSREMGQNPDVEVHLWSPTSTRAHSSDTERPSGRNRSNVWTVVWESGPFEWGIHLTCGSSVYGGGSPPEVLLYQGKRFTAEPWTPFDVCFYPEGRQT